MNDKSVKIQPVAIDFCGREVVLANPSAEMVLFVALAALENEKINGILHSFGVTMKDINGVVFWPPQKAGLVKHAKVSQMMDEENLNGKGS